MVSSCTCQCTVIFTHLLLILTRSPACISSTSFRSFRQANDLIRGPIRLDDSWQALTKISCAVRCVKLYAECRSFLYNPTSGLCTPCSIFQPNKLLPSAAEGSLYTSLKCELRGFWTYIYGNTEACVRQFQPENYTNAIANCHSLGGYLMSIKSRDKFSILINANYAEETWIGCNDLDMDGIYSWIEDGQNLTTDYINNFFLDGPPLFQCGSHGILNIMSLGSNNCSVVQTYICEINLSEY